MPAKILLADKSITIQKVVEMLFSGKEYEVLCVSDGETALNEAARINPDVVLADIDLPRVDGYTFSERLRETPALAKTPVILMMSRDDVYDEAKGRQAMILDHIAKPFESQELIGKVKKAVSGAAPQAVGQAAVPAAPAAAKPQAPAAAPAKPTPAPSPPPKPQVAPARPAAAAASPAPAATQKPRKPAPTDIFDIIEEAPEPADLKRGAAPAAEDEGVYEVEPVIEIEEEIGREVKALPTGAKAVEEMREGLGLAEKKKAVEEEIVSFENLDIETPAQEYKPPMREPEPEAVEWKPPVTAQPAISESDLWNMAEATVSKMAKEMFAKMPPPQAPTLPEQELRSMAEKTMVAMAKDVFAKMPPPQMPQVPADVMRGLVEEAVAKIVQDAAREIVEKVAWEVIPDMAEMLIKAEIERLKAES